MAPDETTETTAVEEGTDVNATEETSEETIPHVVPGVDGGELHITKNGETTTVAITQGEGSSSSSHADSIEVNTLQLEGSIAAAAPSNPGEVLGTSPTNPVLAPDSPGVEPGQGADDNPDDAPEPTEPSPNAPVSTDPGGDTAHENAPDAPAPEPDGPNVATNPGTGNEPTAGGPVGEPSPEATGEGTPVGDGQTSAVSALPLYLASPGAEGYQDAGLETPDGAQLSTYSGDTAGEAHTGDEPVYAEADDDDQPVQAAA